MTKDEAIKAMNEGYRVSHHWFGEEEWVAKADNDLYIFEDGVLCYPDEFWRFRSDDSWENDWSIWNKMNLVEYIEYFSALTEDEKREFSIDDIESFMLAKFGSIDEAYNYVCDSIPMTVEYFFDAVESAMDINDRIRKNRE